MPEPEAKNPDGNTSGEFFYLDENGRKQDADLHADMLDGLSPEAERRQMLESRARTLALGASLEVVDMMYPLPDV